MKAKQELLNKSRISKFVNKVSKIEAYVSKDATCALNGETIRIIRSLTHKRRPPQNEAGLVMPQSLIEAHGLTM